MTTFSISKRNILNKMISLTMAGIFCFTSVSSWANQNSDSTLAPALFTQQPESRQRFQTAGAMLSEEAAHAYIKHQMEKSGIKPKPKYFDGKVVLLAVIPELLANTGQFAHVGLGRYYGMPIVYIDSEVNNYEKHRNIVLKHEIETIRKFEYIRRLISEAGDREIKPKEMKDEVIKYLDSPDPRLAKTKYAGRCYREIEREIHADAKPLDKLYEKYKYYIKIDTEFIAGLLMFYGEDPSNIFNDLAYGRSINIAAGSGDRSVSVQDTNTKGGLGAYFGDKEEGLAAINNIDKESGRSWIMEHIPELRGKFIVTLSMEGNIPEAGDDTVSIVRYDNPDEEGFIGVGIQPGYSHTLKDGKKIKTDYRHLIKSEVLKPVFVGEDAIRVRAWDEDPNNLTLDEAENDPNNPLVKVEIYKINRGGTWSYILMSEVLDVLYPDHSLYEGEWTEKAMKGRRHRFTQEVVFGKAAAELIKRFDRKPDILHLNEAHTVVAAALLRADRKYDNMAIELTNHTLVPAGMERFSIGVMNTDVARMTYVLGLPDNEKEKQKFEKLRSVFVKTDRDGRIYVDFCYAAFKLADVMNAVSPEHARATVKLFKTMYGDEFNKPVIGILNGSGESWKSSALHEWEAKAPPMTEEDTWMDKLWDIHEENKKEAFEEVERRTGIALNPNKMTFWAVRRLVDYKSQYPMLKFLVHLMTADRDVSFTREKLMEIWFRDITNLKRDYENNILDGTAIVDTVLNKIFNYGARKTVNGLGMQVVVGWPPPPDKESWASEFKRWENLPDLKGKFAAVISDAKFLKTQAVSSDAMLISPRPLEEACETSGQRAGLNGGVSIAINGAGPAAWMEEYDEVTGKGSGFFIGSYVDETADGLEADNKKFYREAPADIFEKTKKASSIFYKDDKREWRRLMLNTYIRANETVSARAMEERYALDAHVPAIRARQNTRIISEVDLRDYLDEERNIPGLKVLQKELPFMAESGVKYIYIPGMIKNNGNPFGILDPRDIDNKAGSDGDLRRFIDTAHQPRNGLKVVIDWLANQHVDKKSEICRQHPERFLYTNVSDGNYGLDKGVSIYQGRSLPPDELRRRIKIGEKLKEKIKNMSLSELAEEGTIDIDGRLIGYRLGDENIREKVDGAKTPDRPVIVSGEEALFLVSATDLVSLKDKHPRRWSSLAQPDLSHPDVIRDAIDIGQYWLKKGVDGFRIDAAAATFIDRAKANWGIDVPINLVSAFIIEMRKIKPDCYFMMGDFEKHRELLALASDRDCSAYSDECKNCMIDALKDYYSVTKLINYLRGLESSPHEARENLIYLGPEHDVFTFKDTWPDLSYQDSNVGHFLNTFLPGYQMVFNGEIYGSREYSNGTVPKSRRVLRLEEADPVMREVRKKIFSLPRQHEQLLYGDYHYLETDAPWNALGVARYDDDTIVIGAFNVTSNPIEGDASNSGWATFDMKRIINIQIEDLREMDAVEYVKESMQLRGDGKTWVVVDSQRIKASDLFNKGFGVNVGPKGCEVIRLKKLPVNSRVEVAPEEQGQAEGFPESALNPAVRESIEVDVGRVLSLFSELTKKFEEGMIYEIRYDKDRFVSCPNSEEILNAYKMLIERRTGREDSIKLIPSSGMGALISVKCYKDEKLAGEGTVNINDNIDLAAHPVRLVSLLNMAFAEAHIRKDIVYGQMDDWEKGLIALIKSECKAVTGIDVPEDRVLQFIKNLPKVEPLPIDDIAEYNRLTVLKLQQSA